eukprot:TRINITY_DN6009_c0_g3_i1.p1 TRINITY_DN6009_c0_g3~~TRINITY_DN6009_c0_g3_i1.p1  ORF type:complete len:762 (+),score=178.64 TRINITY_DN6009_c0_g3_i1:275-2560(+)
MTTTTRRPFSLTNQENRVPVERPTEYCAPAVLSRRQEPVPVEEDAEVVVEEKIIDRYGNVSFRRYLRGKFLGKGGFARCYEMKDLDTNKVYAGKIIAKSTLVKTRARQKLTTEIKIHRSLSHKHIVKFVHFFEDAENVYILLEVCGQKSMMELLKRRKRLSEMEVRFYMRQIIEATMYMHGNRVIHRDLKLGNLFLHEMQIKIGDFGLAAKLDHEGQRKKTICGTPNYIAPEVIDGKNGHSYEVDVWSFGVIIYTLIIGKPPFETNDVKTTYERIKANVYDFPDSVPISDAAKKLIRSILHPVPERRPSLPEILQHPFFQGYTPLTLAPSALTILPVTPSSPSKTYTRDSHVFAVPQAPATSPSRSPLSERTNAAPTTTVIPLKQAAAPEDEAMEEVRQQKKIKRVEPKPSPTRLREDMRTRLLKNRLTPAPSATTPTATTTPTQPTTATSLTSSPTVLYEEDEERCHLSAMHQKLVDSFMGLRSTSGHESTEHTSHSRPTAHYPIPTAQHITHSHIETAPVTPPTPTSESTIYVTKWLDYSSRYGLGYLLSNGVIGAHFNDSTKIMLGSDVSHAEYIEHKRSDTQLREDRRSIRLHEAYAHTHTHEITKKITLLKYFKTNLDEQVANDRNTLGADTVPIPYGPTAPASTAPYVKKWMRTKHAIIFRLSNRTIQVNFTDNHKVILSSEAQTVTFVDPEYRTQVRATSQLLKEPVLSREAIERVKYTRDILFHLISTPKKTTTPPKSTSQHFSITSSAAGRA